MKYPLNKQVFFAILLVLVSCQAYNNNYETTDASPTVTSTFTAPIQSPLPFLSSIQIDETVRALYSNNGGCDLPCLWGIRPKETKLSDLQSRWSQIGTFNDNTRSVDAFQIVTFITTPPSDLVNVYNLDTWSLSLIIKNDVIAGVLSNVTVIEEFSVPTVSTFLQYFGQPEEIWVSIIETLPGVENPHYVIVLYYPSKGIYISWRGEVEELVSQTENNMTVKFCPQHMPVEADGLIGLWTPIFYVFDSNQDTSFNEIIDMHLSGYLGESKYYQLLDANESEKFYMMYSEFTQKECFSFIYIFSP